MWNVEMKLVEAARRGNLEDVRKLVAKGVDVNKTDENGRTALMRSIEGGHIDVVRFLLKRDAALDATMTYGKKLLLFSAKGGHLDIVRFLVGQGAAVNSVDGDGRTPLIMSARRGHIDVVRFLLEKDAAVNATDKFGGTPLLYSAEEGYLDVVRFLLKKDAEVNMVDMLGRTPLMLSTLRGHLGLVRFLLEQGAEMETADNEGSTPLILSAEGGHIDVVRFLVERGAKLDVADDDGITPLMRSAKRGHLNVARFLVDRSASLETTSKFGSTPLMFCAKEGHFDVVRFLVERGAAVNAVNKLNTTSLLYSVFRGHLDVVRYLVKQGAELNAADKLGRTPLMHSAIRGHLDVVRYLVEQGAALESTSNDGWTSLMFSAEGGHLDVVRFLLEHGAALETANKLGNTSLMLSAEEGHLDVVRFLLDKGAALENVDNFGWTPLMRSAWRGHLDVVRLLIERGATLEATNNDGWTSLMLSAEEGHLDVVRFLLDQGAALEAVDNDARTPLMHSAMRGHLDVVRYLLERGANVSSIDGHGDTPLIYLLRSHTKEDELIPVVKQMLSNGASPAHCNKKGVSALSLAGYIRFCQLEQMLYDVSRADLSFVASAKPDGMMSSMNHDSSQFTPRVGSQASISECSLIDEHDARRLADNIVSGVAESNNASFTHLNAGTIRATPDMSSPPTLNLATDIDISNDDSLTETLKYVADHCSMANEAAPLYRHVQFRLKTLAATLNGMNSDDEAHAATVAEICAISTRLKSLLVANVNKPVVSRLVSVRSVVETLTRFRTDLDRLETICSDLKVCEWSSQWEELVTSVKQSIVVQTESRLSTLINELSSDDLQIEAMTLLIFELSRYKPYYSRKEQELMQLVHTRIVGYSKLQVMDVKGWFIPRHEVEIRFGDLLGRGSFGVVYRGVWRKSEVVVKMLTSNSEADNRAFFSEVEVWYRVRHRNIVRFLGACHLSSPYFMVCEYAPGGSLPDFLYRERQNGKILVWRKLHEVSLGLFYLHEEGIVHGDLKGDNILVAKDGTAMLTDFGLSFVQSATVATLDKWGAIRWRAPEYVVQGSAGPSFAADAYSLAMVIVESVTGQAPWGLMPDSAVIWCLRNREMLKRPTDCAEMTDEAWDLVSRMSVYEPSERMALGDVVDRLKTFADEEEDREWHQTRVESAE